MTVGQREQGGGVAGLVDHVKALVREQPRQPLAKEHVVLGDQDAGRVGGHARIIDAGARNRARPSGEDGG